MNQNPESNHGAEANPDAARRKGGAPETIAVYDRPTGLKRLPKTAIVLIVAALVVALLAFALYAWVL